MCFYNRKSRSTLRAVDEWIAIATIGRIEDFLATCGTHREVGGNNARSDSAGAGEGAKPRLVARRDSANIDPVD
jgi:hypothetical protein